MRKLRLGMVGGGPGAFIGEVHRIAAQLDNEIELVCGAFSSDPQKSMDFGRSLYLAPERCYADYHSMITQEAKLGPEQGMDLVAIVTPNHLHFPIAKLAAEHGFHIVCDKPATLDLAEALELQEIIARNAVRFALTHTYNGYPMVKEAKHRVATGELGRIVKIVVEYPQGWLASKDDENSKQAEWRMDPARSGISCCMADIGVHAANLAEYISGLEITQLCADLNSCVEGRSLDDDGTVLLRFNNGAKGVLLASQVSLGEQNNLKIRIYGDKASLEWQHLNANELRISFADQPSQLLQAGVGIMSPLCQANMRTPAGHPEGFLEAFANIYRQFSQQLRAELWHSEMPLATLDVPGIEQAVRGMAFIENTVAASASTQKWHDFKLSPMDIS